MGSGLDDVHFPSIFTSFHSRIRLLLILGVAAALPQLSPIFIAKTNG